MINIEMSDECKYCPYAELELRTLSYGDGDRCWIAECIHQQACERIKMRMFEKSLKKSTPNST